MVARRHVALIGGAHDGEVLNVDISQYALQLPRSEGSTDSVVYGYIPAVVFGRVVYVAKQGVGAPTNEDLARVLLKPEIFEAWQAGRSWP